MGLNGFILKKTNENIKEKLNSWEPFRSCLLNSTANPAHFHQNSSLIRQIFLPHKGQIISKAIYSVLDSPKNEWKIFDLIYNSSNKSNFFIFSSVFLEKLEKQKLLSRLSDDIVIVHCCTGIVKRLSLYVDSYYVYQSLVLAQTVRIYHYFNTDCVVYNFTIYSSLLL